MRTVTAILLAVVILVIGAAVGYTVGYHDYPVRQQQHAAAQAEKEQSTLNSEVRAGDAVSVNANTVILKVVKGGADAGKTLVLRETPATTVQVGSNAMNKPGQMVNMTKYYQTGDAIDVLTGDDTTLIAIYRPMKVGELPAETIQQTGK